MTSSATESRLGEAARGEGRPKGRCVGGYVEVAAPAGIVWDIVANFDGWGAWNPLYTRAAGDAREGAEIELTVAVPGMKPMDTRARVHTVRPGECLEYGLSNMAGLLRAFRFIDIVELGPERCGIANGEIMSGPIGALVARAVGPKVGEGLRAMNDRLKELAEANWENRATAG